jgi:ABC-type multidrug transport system ATPase subunit
MQPKILLCDEPTTGLDPVTGKIIMNLIVKANKELGITCIVITHDVPEAMRVSDYLAFLDKGKIQAVGTRNDFIDSPYELLQQFITNAFVEKDAMPNVHSKPVVGSSQSSIFGCIASVLAKLILFLMPPLSWDGIRVSVFDKFTHSNNSFTRLEI